MKFKKIIPFVGAAVLIVGCNKKITSLYNQTLTYQGVLSFLDYNVYGDKTEREYFNENFKNNNIDWEETIKEHKSLKDIDQSNADNALKLISSNLAKEIDEFKIDDNLFKNYRFKIGSKESKKAVINNGKSDKEYKITDSIGDLSLKLESDDDYFIVRIDSLENNSKQWTFFQYSANKSSYIELEFKYSIRLKKNIVISEKEYNAITIDAVPNFIK